jgi:hypothetical protein
MPREQTADQEGDDGRGTHLEGPHKRPAAESPKHVEKGIAFLHSGSAADEVLAQTEVDCIESKK